MYFYYLLVACSLFHFTHSDENNKIACYKCVSSSKKMMPECEDPLPKMKDLKKVMVQNCSTNPRGHMPRCYKAWGRNKENEKIFIRDCGFMTGENRCYNKDIEKDLGVPGRQFKAFNGCIESCDKDYCNSARHLQSNEVNFLVQLLLMSMIAFGLSEKLSLLAFLN